MSRRRSPQEKKALSYAKDRRNVYGENDKSSRKNIPRGKRIPNRVDRHRENLFVAALGPLDLDAAEDCEVTLRSTRSKWHTSRWRKRADAPLGPVVAYRLARRRERAGGPPRPDDAHA
ncbi:hypothetical protein [Nocardia sp. AG03]|uniref:hypothetical protein n=1 Tax=Nocardia sp. AG03 TaxID=3025312 RepID=UPI0024181BFF|nr:hypothetical protein [Nocardia sp. AG03]